MGHFPEGPGTGVAFVKYLKLRTTIVLELGLLGINSKAYVSNQYNHLTRTKMGCGTAGLNNGYHVLSSCSIYIYRYVPTHQQSACRSADWRSIMCFGFRVVMVGAALGFQSGGLVSGYVWGAGLVLRFRVAFRAFV